MHLATTLCEGNHSGALCTLCTLGSLGTVSALKYTRLHSQGNQCGTLGILSTLKYAWLLHFARVTILVYCCTLGFLHWVTTFYICMWDLYVCIVLYVNNTPMIISTLIYSTMESTYSTVYSVQTVHTRNSTHTPTCAWLYHLGGLGVYLQEHYLSSTLPQSTIPRCWS